MKWDAHCCLCLPQALLCWRLLFVRGRRGMAASLALGRQRRGSVHRACTVGCAVSARARCTILRGRRSPCVCGGQPSTPWNRRAAQRSAAAATANRGIRCGQDGLAGTQREGRAGRSGQVLRPVTMGRLARTESGTAGSDHFGRSERVATRWLTVFRHRLMLTS
jgi:hypothetical protein